MSDMHISRWQYWRWGILLLRVSLGIVFILHGSQKVFGAFGGSGPAGFTQYIGSLGFQPAWLWAAMAMFAEFGGGIMLVLGLLTELAALLIIANMLVAITRVKWAAVFFSAAGGFELEMLFIIICLTLLLSGPGILAAWDPLRRSIGRLFPR